MAETATPEVLWAQRSSADEADKNFIYLTISVPDASKDEVKLDLKPEKLTFTGTSTTLKRKYHLDLEFLEAIDPENSKVNHTNKNIELKLQKKDLKEEYWPRLTKEKKKYHFIKTDFDKWVDEDEQNEAPEEDFSQFGGMGGMPGMGGAGGDYGGIDFSKLGSGAPDMPPDLGSLGKAVDLNDIPGYNKDGDDDEEDEEDDDDLPDLEGDDKTAAKK